MAKENEALFAEVSARLGTNVQELFMNLAATLPGNEDVKIPATSEIFYKKEV